MALKEMDRTRCITCANPYFSRWHRLIHYIIYGKFTLNRALKLGEFIYSRNILIGACCAATISSYCLLSSNDYEEHQ